MKRKKILRILKEYKETFQQKYQIVTLGVFGSVARDETIEQSDVDIVVKLKKQDLFNIIGIKQELEVRLESSVDVVSYRNSMNPFLKKKIDKDAVYV